MRLILVFLLLLSFVSASAQSVTAPVLIDGATARKHLTNHQLAPISPIAKANHIAGEYSVQIVVDTTGHVRSATALSGPGFLQSDALSYARTLTYTPFTKDGQPINATTVVSVSFGPNSPLFSDPNPWQKSALDANALCLTAELKKTDPAETAKHCEDVAKAVDNLPVNGNFAGRRATFVEASKALLRNMQTKEALAEADKAIAVVEQGHDDGDGACSAYLMRGEVEAVSNRLAAANLDLTKAEDFERGSMEMIQSDSLKLKYAGTLKSVLTFHAKVLKASGDNIAAQAKMDEAAKL